jgi:hypothetical protein
VTQPFKIAKKEQNKGEKILCPSSISFEIIIIIKNIFVTKPTAHGL